MPGHVGSDAKEMANQLATYSSSHTLTETKPALVISEKVARGKIGTGHVGNMRSTGSPYMDQRQAKGLHKEKTPLHNMLWNCSTYQAV
jgi:hypothetical protein